MLRETGERRIGYAQDPDYLDEVLAACEEGEGADSKAAFRQWATTPPQPDEPQSFRWIQVPYRYGFECYTRGYGVSPRLAGTLMIWNSRPYREGERTAIRDVHIRVDTWAIDGRTGACVYREQEGGGSVNPENVQAYVVQVERLGGADFRRLAHQMEPLRETKLEALAHD